MLKMFRNALVFFYLGTLAVHASTTEVRPGDLIGSFAISGYQVEGNTLLKSRDIERLLQPYTGKAQNFSAIEHAVAALEKDYRRHGFTLVKVLLPEQELDAGVVHLQVLEARLGRVSVSGATHHSSANILRAVPDLKPGTAPNTNVVSEELHRVNENQSKKITLDFSSGATPDTVDAALQVTDETPWAVTAIFDNSGLDVSGRNHVTLEYQNFNLWDLDHVFSMQYTTATEDPSKISVYGAGYHIPLPSLGDSIDLYGSYSNISAATVSAGLLDLQVSGAGSAYGAHYTHALTRIGAYDAQLVFALDRKVYDNNVYYSGVQLGGNVTVDPASVSYVGQWTTAADGVNYYLTGVRNVRGGAQGSAADFAAARSGATPDYGLLRYGAGYIHTLTAQWQVKFGFNGQLTHDALVPGEQFGVGGATSVRGLEEREIADDKGITANLEIYTPNLCGGLGGNTRCQALAFFDDGHVARNDALPGEETRLLVDSAGVGFRLTNGRYVSLQVDYGHVLSATDPAEKGAQRLHALLALSF